MAAIRAARGGGIVRSHSATRRWMREWNSHTLRPAATSRITLMRKNTFW